MTKPYWHNSTYLPATIKHNVSKVNDPLFGEFQNKKYRKWIFPSGEDNNGSIGYKIIIPPYSKAYLPPPGKFQSFNGCVSQQCGWITKSWDENKQEKESPNFQKEHIKRIADEYKCAPAIAFLISYLKTKIKIPEWCSGYSYLFIEKFLMVLISILMVYVTWSANN
jgi:hypothetical protein